MRKVLIWRCRLKAKTLREVVLPRRGKVSKKWLVIRLVILAVVVGGLIISPYFSVKQALAFISQPDSPPTVTQIHVNQSLYATGDRLFYGLYNIPYSVLPAGNVTADVAFDFRLMSADGSTIKGANLAFPYVQNGYGKGIISFYFPASGGIVWGTAYIIRIVENPAYFAAPQSWDVTVPASAYSTYTSQVANQNELANNLYTIGQKLEAAFNKILFQSSGGNIVLSSPDGETYFRGAIPNLQFMCPQIFLVQLVEPTVDTSTNTTMALAAAYSSRFNGTWVGNAENETASAVGVTHFYDFGAFIIGVLCIVFIVFSAIKLRRAEPGMACASALLLMGLILGWVPPALFCLIYQLFGIYDTYLIFYARG